MKKVLFVVAFLSTVSGFSQEEKIKIDVHGGVNYSKLWGYTIPSSFDPVYKESPGVAFVAGVGLEKSLTSRFALKLEVNYERKRETIGNVIQLSASYSATPRELEYTSYNDMNYLTIPVTLKYFISEENSTYISGGVFTGYLIGAKTKIQDERVFALFGEGKSDIDFTNACNVIDFGAVLGVGRNIKIRDKRVLFVELRGNVGMLNVRKFNPWGNDSMKTNSMNLVLGYCIN